MDPKYLYIDSENQVVFFSRDEPTPGDCGFVEVGLLSIIRLSDFTHVDRKGRWQKIKEGNVGRAEKMDGGHFDPAHFHPDSN